MANNTGLIFGTVYDDDGDEIEDADVSLNFIVGTEGQVRVGGNDDLSHWVPKVKTDSDGRYLLPFFWEALDFEKMGHGVATASILVMVWGDYGAYKAKNQRGRVYISLDIRKLIGVGYPPVPASTPELANVLKDFYASYKDILKAHHVFYPGSPMLTAELMGLVGEIDVYTTLP